MKRIGIFFGMLLVLCLSHSVFAQVNIDPNAKPKFSINDNNNRNYTIERVDNDPLNARIYTLKNGLKVYMSVNKEEPRIQTYIAVRAGSKNDPAETTGLAHYFEHLMFKGTKQIGTTDWEAESKYIQQIEDLYELYVRETDKEKRADIYRNIDKLSFSASKLAIPNEYDKLMKLIGANGTNAATSNDFTYYIENIPSNQIENWARIQSDRFQNPVLRLFHTELETVYEEKNMSLINDRRKTNEAMLSALFPNHPYGTQTTLGSSDHLRNPSMVAINNFFDTYYVPNNYCIAMSGDFDPEQAIQIIEKYFGSIPSKEVAPFTYKPEQEIKEVKTIEVVGLEAENITIAFRINAGSTSHEVILANLLDRVLNNGSSGIMDININQKQLAANVGSSVYDLNDYASFILRGTPKTGQSLDELRDLLLKQLEVLKAGDWDESILKAIINNERLSQIKELETNNSRAMKMVTSYLSRQSWDETVSQMARMSKVTKDDLVKFAREIFKDNNYVVIKKLQGEAKELEKVDKPPITPIHVNRDLKSKFFESIERAKVKEIEPVFVDYTKDLQFAKLNNGAEILYVPNIQNETFYLAYEYDFGVLSNKRLGLIGSYQGQLSTPNLSVEDIKTQFYNLACSIRISSGDDFTRVTLSGLTENLPEAITLLENILSNPIIEKEALDNIVKSILKNRNDAKARQASCFSALNNYVTYGKENAFYDFIPEAELMKLTPEMIRKDIKDLTNYTHKIHFYGNMPIGDLKTLLNTKHNSSPKKLTPAPKVKQINPIPTEGNKVYFVHYDAKQSYCRQLTRGGIYDESQAPVIALYNQYFGGSMNSIVFQEMREKRSLAYQSSSRYISPSRLDGYYQNMSHIATQNDKVIDAFDAFNELFDQMPIALQNFNLAKDAMVSNYRTSRISKERIIYSYLQDLKMGRKTNPSKKMFETIPNLKMDDIVKFNNKFIKNQPRTYVILGNKDQVNLKALEKYGKVQTLSLEEIFGY